MRFVSYMRLLDKILISNQEGIIEKIPMSAAPVSRWMKKKPILSHVPKNDERMHNG